MSAIFSLSLFGFAQTLMLCLGLSFSPKKREAAACLFFAFQTIVCLIFLRSLLASSGVLTDHPEFIGWGLWVTFMAPPLVYFFMQFALCHDYKFPQNTWLHFVPAVLGGVCTVLMFAEDPMVRKLMVETLLAKRGALDSSQTYLFWVFQAEQVLIVAQIMFYWWISGEVLNTGKSDSGDSTANQALVKWMRAVRHAVLLFIVFSVLIGLINAFVTAVPVPVFAVIRHSILILIVVSTFWYSLKSVALNITPTLGHDTLREQSVDGEPSVLTSSASEYESNIVIIDAENHQNTAKQHNDKYEKSKLSQQRIKQIAEQFEAVMLKEKYFLNDALSLSDVSNYLECSSNHLSQAINVVYEKTFTDLISDMRVEEAKRLLSMSAEATVLDICMMAGFKSKSGFYKSFKKYTGLTPTAYRQAANFYNS
jgi:AraC-like DNA-binding protein